MLLGTSEEQECFQLRYEESNDLTDDERYNLWIKAYHPEDLQVQLFTDSPVRLPPSTSIPPSLSLQTHLCILLPSLLSFHQFPRSPSSSPALLSTRIGIIF